MQFSAIVTLLAGVSTAVAVPAMKRQASAVCSGLQGQAQCCATDVLGVADLNCATPPSPPRDVHDFKHICASIGQQAECCTLPLAGQALICVAPS
ncbi:MAG: Fungal hydrophobin [Heterodermia speciosa]|uniref:Fungal hydrophobin n=1 Tax=Heterodermia speciosa TaxID=116794 RepID=A0A8H3IZM5_9LECA|nr:MAG: Fungal hydrophobin [Heterodermia speciosa]